MIQNLLLVQTLDRLGGGVLYSTEDWHITEEGLKQTSAWILLWEDAETLLRNILSSHTIQQMFAESFSVLPKQDTCGKLG